MSFASPSFVFFLPIFILGTLLLRRRALLLFSTIGAYVFYAGGYAPYCILLFVSTVVDYFVGLGLGREDATPFQRKLYMSASLVTNLGLLAVYKYSGFAAASMNHVFSALHIHYQLPVPHLLLPIGISFYSFQTLSYTIDVYRRKIGSEKSLLNFAFYVSFFPHLVAGPIVRARDFLPQVEHHSPFGPTDTIRGIELIVVGLFKKLVVADNCAVFAERVFDNPGQYGGGAMWLGALFFAIQIYGDFSGYSDVARGLARMMGLYIKPNFRWPYFAASMAEFWRRWHMSLSYWLRDYLYVSLGGSRVSRLKLVRNLALTWFLSGLWHGAAWHFVAWGLYQGAVISGERIIENTKFGYAWEHATRLIKVPLLFLLVLLGWVLFRAPEMGVAATMWKQMLLPRGGFLRGMELFGTWPLVLVGIAALAHWVTWRTRYDIDHVSVLLRVPYGVRIALIVVGMLAVIIFAGAPRDFIYFAF